MTLVQALSGEHVSPRERGRFAGYFATVFALASTSGPVFGAYLTEHFGWRAVCVVNVPSGLVAATLAAMPEVLHLELAARLATAYRAVFQVLAAIAATGVAIASTIPKTDWKN